MTNDDFEKLDNGKLTPAEAAQMGLIGPDNPDEDDHQSKLDQLDTSIHAAMAEEESLQGENSFPMKNAAKFLFGDAAMDKAEEEMDQAARDLEPELPPSDPWAPQDQETVLESGETPMFDSPQPAGRNHDEQRDVKRQYQQKRLEELGKAVLDRTYAEYAFNHDPRFAEANKIISGDEEPSEADASKIFESLKVGGPGVILEYILGAMKFPAERAEAVTQYNNYRSMLEDFS